MKPKVSEEEGSDGEDLFNKSCQTDINFKELMDKLNNME